MCGVGAKSVAHLMKFHLLQWKVVKVKFLMNSNMTLPVLNLHQKTDPKVQQDFKGQGHYDKVKSRSDHDAAHLHPLTNVPSKYQLPTPHGFRDIARTRFYSIWNKILSNFCLLYTLDHIYISTYYIVLNTVTRGHITLYILCKCTQ